MGINRGSALSHSVGRLLAAVGALVQLDQSVIAEKEKVITALSDQIEECARKAEAMVPAQLSPVRRKNVQDGERHRGIQFAQEHERVQRIVNALKDYPGSAASNGMYRNGLVSIDCCTAQGRWELLVLALLLGGLVRAESAESSFLVLRNRGLLELDILANPDSELAGDIQTVLNEHYRGVADRRAKAEAIVQNARFIAVQFGGDLQNIYLRHRNTGVVPVLRAMAQLDKLSLWFAQKMKAAGVWSELPAADTCYIDRYVRMAVGKLGLLEQGLVNWRQVSPAAALDVVSQLFQYDALPLQYLGKELCSQENLDVCRSRCPVQGQCLVWL